MKNIFTLQQKNPTVRFLQITDPHLFEKQNGQLLGINTAQSFQAVLDEIQQSQFDYDFILATGDLVQDQSTEGYQRFCEMVKPLKKPIFWIPGNHDFQPKMVETLKNYPQLHSMKHILAGEHWQLLLLDSQIFGSPHGALSDYQLDWLVAKLSQYPTRYTMIILHHHILPTNSAWLDQHNLRNARELEESLVPFSNVKAILHGHIHQAVDTQWRQYRVLATPSTCIQFKADCHNFTLDLIPPGWREVSLHPDGGLSTQVKRIHSQQFLPDISLNGY